MSMKSRVDFQGVAETRESHEQRQHGRLGFLIVDYVANFGGLRDNRQRRWFDRLGRRIHQPGVAFSVDFHQFFLLTFRNFPFLQAGRCASLTSLNICLRYCCDGHQIGPTRFICSLIADERDASATDSTNELGNSMDVLPISRGSPSALTQMFTGPALSRLVISFGVERNKNVLPDREKRME
ncbi:unnamed protein product [Nesidiocoris tenuis]|uniref:Uncharacterized protein n=1 Tax=Nesidiocoris tenuis TaxID=355587 RepID=A0A6H5GUE6_9HEMI|nr:unnamed protein product [Nesidiocoris tenuis]